MAHEPCDESSFIAAYPMFEAKRFRIGRPEFRVISAATFGDIVKKTPEIGYFRNLQRLHDF